MKKTPLTVLTTAAVVLLIVAACKDHENIPEKVAEMRGITQKVYKNDKGFWEAELEDSIFIVYIPAGEFPMGSEEGEADERPVHTVYLDGYWLWKYPVTVGQFKKFVEETGYVTDPEKGERPWQYLEDIWNHRDKWAPAADGWEPYTDGYTPVEGKDERDDAWIPVSDGNWHNTYLNQAENHPVVCVSWNDAMAYGRWLSDRLGLPVTLPSEAQWEHAARGVDGRPYPWGFENPDGRRANYADLAYFNSKYGHTRQPDPNVNDGYVETSPVNAFPAGQSPYGIFDMAGNASEWVFDYYDEDYYANSPYKNPYGLEKYPVREKRFEGGFGDWESNKIRVMRSEAWNARSGVKSVEGGHNIRSGERSVGQQYSADDHLGFRCTIDYNTRFPTLLIDSKIAFHSQRDGNSEIYTMYPAGFGIERLTGNESAHDAFPDWSPDGSKIAFESDRDGNSEIYIMNSDGSDQTRITRTNGNSRKPDWSPDGRKIAFFSDISGNNDIFVINVDGTELVNLSHNPAQDESPRWSPDGSQIVFESNRNGNRKIYIMNSDGSDPVRLTHRQNDDMNPCWSPDGNRIAFNSNRNDGNDIYVIDADGSNEIRLTVHPSENVYPAWSPKGEKIIFCSDRNDGDLELYLMDAQGHNQARLTLSPGIDAGASWSPYLERKR